jgi:hypothetical protein
MSSYETTIQVSNDAASGLGLQLKTHILQKYALKTHRNIEVQMKDSLKSRNISWQSCGNEVGNVAAMNGLECRMIQVGNDAASHPTRQQFKSAMMPQTRQVWSHTVTRSSITPQKCGSGNDATIKIKTTMTPQVVL